MLKKSRLVVTRMASSRFPINLVRAERRHTARYPLEMTVHVSVRGEPTCSPYLGRSINISRDGLLFRSSIPMFVGQALEGLLLWPEREAGGTVALQWKGTVVRRQGEEIGVKVARYLFRTIPNETATILNFPS